jgi:hypothetical protein
MNVWMMFEDFWRISGDFWGNGSRQQKREIQPGNTSGIGKSSTNGYYIIHRGLSPACQGKGVTKYEALSKNHIQSYSAIWSPLLFEKIRRLRVSSLQNPVPT